MGRPALGVAVPDGAGPVRALERRSGATPQEADRLGAPGDPAGQALAGEAARDHCRQLRLRRTRSDRGGAAACLPGHPVAPRCQPVRAGTGAATGAARPATSQRRALAEARRGAGRSRDRLVVDHAAGVVRRPAADARDHFRDGGVVSQRPAARADPLGAGARSRREAGTAGVPGDRPRNHSGRNSRLVRLTLARRNDVPGSPRPSRRRDAAPMVRSGDRTHHPGAARAVLPGDDLDARIDRNPWRRHPSPDGRLVWQARPDLQRRHRHRPPRPLVPAGFMDVPARRGNRRNPRRPPPKIHRDSLLRRMKCGKSSLEAERK